MYEFSILLLHDIQAAKNQYSLQSCAIKTMKLIRKMGFGYNTQKLCNDPEGKKKRRSRPNKDCTTLLHIHVSRLGNVYIYTTVSMVLHL